VTRLPHHRLVDKRCVHLRKDAGKAVGHPGGDVAPRRVGPSERRAGISTSPSRALDRYLDPHGPQPAPDTLQRFTGGDGAGIDLMDDSAQVDES
jgi:hypothetical protein